MREISLHIMDIAENGVGAGANLIDIIVDERRSDNQLTIEVIDNGRGIPEEILDKVTDPFFTSRTTRRVGLGLSLLKAAAERCDGTFQLTSTPGKGSRVLATFAYDHIDRAPLGDMATSFGLLMVGNQDIDFTYTHRIDGEEFEVDTREIRQELGGLSLANPAVYPLLVKSMKDAVGQLGTDRNNDKGEKNGETHH